MKPGKTNKTDPLYSARKEKTKYLKVEVQTPTIITLNKMKGGGMGVSGNNMSTIHQLLVNNGPKF